MAFSVRSIIVCSAAIALFSPCWAGDLEVKEPEKAETLTPRKPERDRWSWNKPGAEVTPTGDLKWKAEPFVFKSGDSARYIDFDGGNDDNAGSDKKTAWKHHPWDAAAGGKAKECKGIHTYVFKRGAVYRGELVGGESGDEKNPIRLTSDPAWGAGEAVLSGAERVSGWKQGATHKDIPDASKVWYADLNFAPRNLWEVDGDKIERVELARIPNWKVSDPEDVMSEWWTWEQPEWWTGKNKTKVSGHDAHLGIDTKHLTQSAEYYTGAIVRTEFGIVMGTPFPTQAEAFDAQKKGIAFQGPWTGASETIITKNRYFLEDKPHYLAEPGEFWFEKTGEGGRLFVRLKGDRDPNKANVEAGRHMNLLEDKASATAPARLDLLGAGVANLDLTSLNHVVISGLTFRFTNNYWDAVQPPWMHKDVDNACIKLQGSCNDVRISNCRFVHASKAISIKALNNLVKAGNIVIADNDIQFIDHGAINVADAGSYLGDVKVLRNNLFMIGMRAFRQDWSHAVIMGTPVTLEVAGNVLQRTYGAGLFIMRGKDILGNGDGREIPLGRALIHGNRVTDSLLSANDWGGIEVNGAGPAYVYNNISGNANGYWNWSYDPNKPCSARLGMAYYLDGGGSKTFLFNNVAWGNTDDVKSRLCNQCAFYEAGPNIFNSYFNNTVCNFAMGSNWSPAGGRYAALGNLWMNVGGWVFMHGKVKEDKDPPPSGEYPLFGDAYGRNVFFAHGKDFAVFEAAGGKHDSVESMSAALTKAKSLSLELGIEAKTSPVKDAKQHDFHLAAKSEAIGQGVKVFVPWALAQEVGAWNFRRNNSDPTTVLDEHWFGARYVTDRIAYTHSLLYNLKGVGIGAESYAASPLEDWTPNAVKLNGKDQFLTIANADLVKPYTYKLGDKTPTIPGNEMASPDIAASNLLIEAYFQAEPNRGASVIVSKLADSGYQLAINKAGGVTLTLNAAGRKAELASGARVNDGKWHHVLAEADRQAKTGTIYVDGVKASSGALDLDPKASLSNSSDLFVGKNASGGFFTGALAYLRIARGTLADAKTSIEELYDWQFDGPFLRDFAGHEVTGKARDAGAFEYVGDK